MIRIFLILLTLVFLYPNEILCEGMDIINWESQYTLNSNVGVRLSILQRSVYVLDIIPSFYLGIFIGLILSDAHLQIRKGRVNARLHIGQSFIHFDYLFWVFILLSHYCQSYPHIHNTTFKGIKYSAIVFNTRAYPFLTTLHNIFYLNGVKGIPMDIYDYLTPVALAHWIMGDGTWDKSGVILCTDSYTLPDVVRLINVLIIKYRLNVSLRYCRTYPRLYIRSNSIPLLRSIVLQLIHYIYLKFQTY